MKRIYFFLISLGLVCTSTKIIAGDATAMAALTPLDTITFDLSQSEFSTVDGVSYIEFPVILRTDDLVINAVDFWFQFNLNKLTYVATTSTVSTLDVYTNYNNNNQFLSNTSSTTSINVYLPVYVTIMKLKFSLNDPCADILDTDFYAPTALLNGVVSSYLFVPMTDSPETAIEISTPEPYCPGSDIAFTYASEANGQPITDYAWDFDNGQTASGQTVSGSFSSEGTFTVTLEATTENGCVHTYTTTVQVQAAPIINFSSAYDPDLNIFNFTNQSTISNGTIVSYFWEFGDGQTSEDFEPQHGYASEGFYDVTLTAVSDLGCESSFTTTLEAPVAILELRSLGGALSLYPNPASQNISLTSSRAMRYYVVDDLARRVSEEGYIGVNQTVVIPLEDLAAGLYTVVGYDQHEITHVRFVVQH